MNTFKILPENLFVNKETGFTYRFVDSRTERLVLHRHQYYEMFLTYDDDITHIINGKEKLMKSGTLVFIRPNDLHTYMYPHEGIYRLINFTISKQIIDTVFSYLGNALPIEAMLAQELPPMAFLSKHDTEKIWLRFEELASVSINDTAQIMLKCKILLFDLLSKYFVHSMTVSNDSVPVWLDDVCRRMQRDKNFTQGIPKMLEMCGKSAEHLSRSMKKYYGISPTTFVDDLRLNYTVNMLINSNMPILDICFESGFQNVSWFNTLFKQKFGMAPSKFRRENRHSEILVVKDSVGE